MAKSDLGKYMTPSARYFIRAQQPRILTPTRSSKTIDPSLFSGKKAAAGAPLASRQVAAPIQETGPEAMSITDGEASAQPQIVTETQQPIENRGDSARYMIQGGGPKIDLSFLVPERANKAFDPSKAIGGENVPYQESTGVGGFFRRLLGDESNRMNIEAQQAQGAEWRDKALRDEERTAKREDLANEINLRTEAERGLKKEDREFTATQAKAARDFQSAENSLDRVLRSTEGGLDRNLRVSLAAADRDAAANRLDKELGFRSSESAADRAFRSSEGAAERGFRAGESKADREARLAEGEANRALTAAHYNLVREDNAADRNLRASEGAAGRELQREGQRAAIQYKQSPRVERLGENVYTNEKGEVFEHTPGMPAFGNNKGTPGGFRRLPMPGAMAPKGSGGGQVDRTTGATLGGPLMNNQLPPGGGVMRPGGTAATMGVAQPTAEPRYATLGDRLLTLPGMGAIVDMPRIMNPERTARLAESRSLQDAENRERIRRMQQEAGGDIGPSMF